VLVHLRNPVVETKPEARKVQRPEELSMETMVRDDRAADGGGPEQRVLRFAERVADCRANVRRVSRDELPAAVEDALEARRAYRVVVPADLPSEWRPARAELLVDGELGSDVLDAADGVLTGCALGIAETGTIVLDGGARQGRRAISLLPDYHLCVVEAEQIVGTVPEAIAALGDAARERRPITFVSGPSATSDVELSLVEGVHGPRSLEVLVVG
jgi:L-lactate dehydrogenase complex protein LldG